MAFWVLLPSLSSPPLNLSFLYRKQWLTLAMELWRSFSSVRLPSASLFPSRRLSFSLTCFFLFLVQERSLCDRWRQSFKQQHVLVHWAHMAPATLDGDWRPPISSDDGSWSVCGRGHGSPTSLVILMPILTAKMYSLKFLSISSSRWVPGLWSCFPVQNGETLTVDPSQIEPYFKVMISNPYSWQQMISNGI